MANNNINKTFLTLNQAADVLSISTATMRRLIIQQQIPAYKFGKQFRVESEALEHYIQTSSISSSDT